MKKTIKFIILGTIVLCLFGFNSQGNEANTGKSAVSSLSVQTSGLVGELVVVLNEQEELILKGNGLSSFKSELKAGDAYQVNIRQAPPGQDCELRNSNGTIAAGKGNEVEAVCRKTGAWQHPSSPADALGSAGQDSGALATAINDRGNSMVAWSRFADGTWQVMAREAQGGTWLKENVLFKATDTAKNPKVAMAANDDAVIIWEQAEQNRNYIMMAERRNGVWSLPTSTADRMSLAGKYAWEVDLALNESGETIIAWSQEAENGVHAIYKSEYRNGQWQHPHALKDHISPIQAGDALRPRVAFSDSGAALIAWEQHAVGFSRIFISQFQGNAWHHPRDRNDYIKLLGEGNRNAYTPMVAMDAKGNGLLAWKQGHGNRDRIYLSESKNGKWNHPQSLEDAVSPLEIIAADINDAKMSGSGDAVLLWTSFKDRRQSLYKSEFRQGKWDHPAEGEMLVADALQWQFMVNGRAAMGANGRTVISWLQRGDDNITRAYFTEYDNGQWHLPGTLLNIEDRAAANLSMSSSPRGNFIIAWQQSDDKDTQVYASVYRISE